MTVKEKDGKKKCQKEKSQKSSLAQQIKLGEFISMDNCLL